MQEVKAKVVAKSGGMLFYGFTDLNNTVTSCFHFFFFFCGYIFDLLLSLGKM